MTSGLPNLSSTLSSLPSLVGGGTPAPTQDSTGAGPSWLQGKLPQYVTIGLGLVLIVAGLFQFKQVQQVTGAAAKGAAIAA